ncbi:hypothetical protein ELE36_14750 [Pseudolysobacter antarcticus]|uniref:Uncharacterized protein n=1 Tax=Pseudolysobacter antarcticus TaxID=2511995 RepID=A0A411HLV3_9GAMM|nr:hypothetical protein [Pseudolysobacter antarcticus]QBB71512.1 hypothetical protein ELE36_14750 [Pseudolysobacter antarcticus]
MNSPESPDAICAGFAEASQKLTFRALEEGTVLIEGSAAALEFLGTLLIAQARFDKDCGFQLSPTGAGNAVFSDESNLGFYIHRTPCKHVEGS